MKCLLKNSLKGERIHKRIVSLKQTVSLDFILTSKCTPCFPLPDICYSRKSIFLSV